MTVGREISPIGQATGKWHAARGKIAAEALRNNAGESAGLLGHDLEEFDVEH